MNIWSSSKETLVSKCDKVYLKARNVLGATECQVRLTGHALCEQNVTSCQRLLVLWVKACYWMFNANLAILNYFFSTLENSKQWGSSVHDNKQTSKKYMLIRTHSLSVPPDWRHSIQNPKEHDRILSCVTQACLQTIEPNKSNICDARQLTRTKPLWNAYQI